jgi:hypothetical protein
MHLQNFHHKLQRPIAHEGRAALNRLLLVQRFAGGKLALAGVIGWRKCLFSPIGPIQSANGQGCVPGVKGRISIMGYEYSIRNVLYTFSDKYASCPMSLQQTLFFLASYSQLDSFRKSLMPTSMSTRETVHIQTSPPLAIWLKLGAGGMSRAMWATATRSLRNLAPRVK